MSKKPIFLAAGVLIVSALVVNAITTESEGLNILRLLHVIKGDEKIVRIVDQGMEPTMMQDSTWTYKEVPFESLEVGDVILFSGGRGLLLVRRIVAINEDGSLVVKGDAIPHVEPVNITKEMYIGKIIR
jgi:hypothetical protein